LGYAASGGKSLSSWMIQLNELCDLKMLDWTDEEWEKAKGATGSIPLDVDTTKIFRSRNMPEIVHAVGTPYMWSFPERMPEIYVYEIVKALCDNTDWLAQNGGGAGVGFRDDWHDLTILTIPSMQKIGVFVHPGAARYYKEIGIWQDEWTIGKCAE